MTTKQKHFELRGRVATLQLIKDRYNSNSIEQHSQNCVRDRIETDKKHPKCRVIGSH